MTAIGCRTRPKPERCRRWSGEAPLGRRPTAGYLTWTVWVGCSTGDLAYRHAAWRCVTSCRCSCGCTGTVRGLATVHAATQVLVLMQMPGE